ncbi:MAG: DUF2760 domain-containing protein [Spartobacteria bacterium]|nr:DUF2760 domain-containing protein [Spartobacteria bacterium]
MSLGLAFKAMFKVLGNAAFAQQVQELMKKESEPAVEVLPEKEPVHRSDALTVLSAMQREGRFIDFMMESLDEYNDAQIGAAVRDVHRGCAATLKRFFDFQPQSDKAEGASIEVPAGFDPAAYHLTGNVTGEPPYKGKVCHHGWKAARCELPQWTGREDSIFVAAPVEVEV